MSLLDLADDLYLLLHVLHHLPFQNWITLSNTSRYMDSCIRNCFFEVMHTHLLEFVPEQRIPKFFSLLLQTNSIVTGSLPLTMLGVLPWGQGKDLIVYSPIAAKRRWDHRFRWKLDSESFFGTGGAIHSTQQLSSYMARSLVLQGGLVRMVYVNGPHVLDVLAKASETALFSCLTATSLITAYPRMTLHHQTLTLIVTDSGQTIGAECLFDFQPVAFRQHMPAGYAGIRTWSDSMTMVFHWSEFASELERLGGGFAWSFPSD
ncbi:hypothetical protein K435DRAFT_872528 [Dendrothele bispora CBS 962.96]|uniref:F-box domain-containing protein n=1 Tax=Dendrothele bispora (strain CBS 962.96) TaxID=1314807 RepID=A0A4S8L1E4_DENBC|nr:hypothetical protein K435DRAFT_872528 [Dendrothele bispora CBS 962.96]